MSTVLFTLDDKQADLMAAFEKGDHVEDRLYIEGRDANKKATRITMSVESLGNLVVGDYGHSLLCKLTNDRDAQLFENFQEAACTVISEKIDFKSFVKDDKFFMKLPFKNDKYTAIIDPVFLPSQPDKAPFTRGSQVEIEFVVSMWISFGDQRKETKVAPASGLFLSVSKVTVDGGKKRTIRKR